jgi:hypothetical protein
MFMERVAPASERNAQLLRLLRLAVLLAALTGLALTTSADPDLWGHIRFGQDVVVSRALQVTDPYSFTSDRPWINHEWLAEVITYGAYAIAGSTGLVVLKMILLAGVLICILISLRPVSGRPAVHDMLVGVAVTGMWLRALHVRPQLFSLLLFALLMFALTRADRATKRVRAYVLALIPLIFAAWANLHGGYLVGLGVLAVWLAVRVWQAPRRWPALCAVGLASLGATLLTPYGPQLWRFLWETVGLERRFISDWRSALDVGPILLLPLLVVLVTAASALRRMRGRVDPAILAILAVLVFGTARIGRIDAFLAISVVMLLGPLFGGPEAAPRTRRMPWRSWSVAAAVGLFLVPMALLWPRISCIEVLNYLQLDAEAASVLRMQKGRLLPYFDWGEYAIWHFAPHLKVSMDGRRETVYSEEMIDMHFEFYHGRSLALVDRISPDVIWLPRSFAVVAQLERNGWRPVFRGRHSVVLTRHATASTAIVETQGTETRCFPGP